MFCSLLTLGKFVIPNIVVSYSPTPKAELFFICVLKVLHKEVAFKYCVVVTLLIRLQSSEPYLVLCFHSLSPEE